MAKLKRTRRSRASSRDQRARDHAARSSSNRDHEPAETKSPGTSSSAGGASRRAGTSCTAATWRWKIGRRRRANLSGRKDHQKRNPEGPEGSEFRRVRSKFGGT